MAIGLTMLSACSDDDGDFFPSVITDLVLATSDSDGMLYQVTTDNGTIHNIAHHKLNISTPDTVIRCMISYTIQDDCATLYSISPVYCNKAYKPEDIIIIKDSVKIPGTEYLPRDPVKVISMWQSPSFINLHLGIMTTGNSMGGTHALNFLLRRPDIFAGCIALSGAYNAREFFPDYFDDLVYANSPVDYIEGMPYDHPYVEMYRNRQIIVCCGRGAWENPMQEDSQRMKELFEHKNIPAWVDFWGSDVCHDWPWWKKQLPYYLNFVC